MFDQPNLKGRFAFTALAPADWKVITGKASSSVQIWNPEAADSLPSYFS